MVTKDRRKNVQADVPSKKKTSVKKVLQAPKKPMLYRLVGQNKHMVRFDWDEDVGDYAGRSISFAEAADAAAEVNPPIVKPVRDEPDMRYYCEWSLYDNEYICDKVSADDPRVKQAQ